MQVAVMQQPTYLAEKVTIDLISVITVRLPESLHESLRIEAHEHHTSMNKLCISKLLQLIEENMIPSGSAEMTS